MSLPGKAYPRYYPVILIIFDKNLKLTDNIYLYDAIMQPNLDLFCDVGHMQ